CPRPRPSSLPEVAPVASLGVDLRTGAKRTSTRRPTFPYPPPPLPWPESAGICHGSRRFVRMPSELPAARSPPFLNQISRVRHQRSSRSAGGTFKGSN
ncbi:hypothetical protein Prudu_001916, partial [Prunus dulcis]